MQLCPCLNKFVISELNVIHYFDFGVIHWLFCISAAKQTQTLLFPQLVTQSLLFSWKSNIKLLTEPLSTCAAVTQRSSVKRIEKNCKFHNRLEIFLVTGDGSFAIG